MMNEKTPSRRRVLHGVLAAGFGLCLPATLLKAANNSPLGSANAAEPPAAKKVTQASVKYQGQPKGDQKCSLCMHFIAASTTCKLVEGKISPDGWCMLWAKKA